MTYEGQLFGKIGGKYIPLNQTSHDVDALAAELARMVRYYEGREIRPEALAKINDAKNAIRNAGY